MPFTSHHESASKIQDIYLPPNLPSFPISEEEFDGWRRPSYGETVRSFWQAYLLIPSPGWRISAYWTSDAYVHQGLTHYRAPASLKAWVVIIPQVLAKAWRNLWSHPKRS